MLPILMAVCGAAGAVVGAVTAQAANEKNKQAIKKYEKINTELINKRNALEKRYYELSEISQQQINNLNLKLVESEVEKDALYLAIRLQNNLILLMESISKKSCLETLVKFKKAIALTNHVLQELGENLVPVSQDYFSRILSRVDRNNDYSQEQLFDYMNILLQPEVEIINSFIKEVENEVLEQKPLSLNINYQNEEEKSNLKYIDSKLENLENWIQQGKQYLDSKKYEQALSCFDMALQISGQDDEIWFYLSICLSYLDKITESIHAINKALKINPNNSEYFYHQSCCLLTREKNQDALEAINKALKINSNNSEYWYHKSCCLLAIGINQDAVQYINRAIRIDYDNDWYWNYKGLILSDSPMKLYDAALEAFDKAIKLNSEQVLYKVNKAATLYDLDRDDEALELVNAILEIEPNCEMAWYWQGRILFDMTFLLLFDKKEEALEAFEEAIQISPDNAEYWYWKSRCLFDLFKKKPALRAIKKAIELDSTNSEYISLKREISK